MTQAIGQIAIAAGITTENNQFYQADIIAAGGDESQTVALTSRQGTVTIVLGQRAGSGIRSTGNFIVTERAAFIGVPDSDQVPGNASNTADAIGNQQADTTQNTTGQGGGQQIQSVMNAAALENRLITGEQAEQIPMIAQVDGEQSSVLLLDAQVEVGEIGVLTCEAPLASSIIELDDC